MAAALNSCGYDAGLEAALPLRSTVRREIDAEVKRSPEAAQARDAICRFWNEHQPQGTSSDVTQYISLAIELGPAPFFAPALPEADLPPDAAHVLGVISLLQKFYRAADMQSLWQRHRGEYESLVHQFHDSVSETITQTDRYLKLPFSNYPGQRFVVYLEPQLSPAHVDARNYGTSYLVVVSPGQDGLLKLPAIRHTYLHFALEPMALKHGTSLKRLEPILLDIKAAPVAREYKSNISLMVNESLIRAIEARTALPKSEEAAREAAVERSVAEGFVLAHYFYQALASFEKGSTGMRDAYGDLLINIDLERERKRARDVAFAAQATPEVISSSKPFSPPGLLDSAEQKLAAGDTAGAQALAQQVAQHNNGGDEPGRAAFILARIAIRAGNMDEARVAFEQAIESVRDPHVLAWSHIYLGRIFDVQQNREAAEENIDAAEKDRQTALEHYRAALASGDAASETRRAAESGLAEPYQARAPH